MCNISTYKFLRITCVFIGRLSRRCGIVSKGCVSRTERRKYQEKRGNRRRENVFYCEANRYHEATSWKIRASCRRRPRSNVYRRIIVLVIIIPKQLSSLCHEAEHCREKEHRHDPGNVVVTVVVRTRSEEFRAETFFCKVGWEA